MFHTCVMEKTALQNTIKLKFQTLRPFLNERAQRLWAAGEAEAIGRGGVSQVAKATKISRTTIHAGLREQEELRGDLLKSPLQPDAGRTRRPGAGRKKLTEKDQALLRDFKLLVDPVTRGDPESPLCWTSKSTEKLAAELRDQGHKVSADTVGRLLHDMEFSLQANRKTKEGTEHPDRDEQFAFINSQAKHFLKEGQPVISVDTKKKELVGDYKNGGREWHPKGESEAAQDHDFPKPDVPKAIPYGIYDIGANQGWVSVGTDHDTPEFAVQAIRTWWKKMGQPLYPEATQLLVTADCGGSNGYRVRAWKMELQGLADETGLAITVSHFPPGTSKWNKIEHRMFCHITQNWRGRMLVSLEAIVSLIGSATTSKGLKIRAGLELGKFETGRKVSDEELANINLEKAAFQGVWNYTIRPHQN